MLGLPQHDISQERLAVISGKIAVKGLDLMRASNPYCIRLRLLITVAAAAPGCRGVPEKTRLFRDIRSRSAPSGSVHRGRRYLATQPEANCGASRAAIMAPRSSIRSPKGSSTTRRAFPAPQPTARRHGAPIGIPAASKAGSFIQAAISTSSPSSR